MDRHEPTFRLTRDDITELKINAVWEFIEWLGDTHGLLTDVDTRQLWSAYAGKDACLTAIARFCDETSYGMQHSWSYLQDFDSSVTAEAWDDVTTDETKSATASP